MTITNLDPNPYRCDRHGGRWGDDQTCYTCVDERGVTRPTHDGSLCVYDPRAEFDVGDNPILIAVAAEPDNDWLAWLAEPETDDGSYTLNGRHESFTRKQVEHARTVLERIVVPGNQKES